MAEYGVILWHGSGLTSPIALQQRVSWFKSALGSKVRRYGIKPHSSPIVTDGGDNAENAADLADEFLELLDSDDRRMIICADGGSGAARIAHHMCNGLITQERVTENIVIGASDSSVYVLWATISSLAMGFYGVNFMGSQEALIEGLQRVREWVEHPEKRMDAFVDVQNVSSVRPSSEPYTVIPMCLRTLNQITGPVRQLTLRYLKSQRCFLLVEDAYPAGDLNWIGFYEDLTHMAPFIEAVAEGGGAIGFGPVPGIADRLTMTRIGYDFDPPSTAGLVRDALRWLGVQIPAFCNVAFGHHAPDYSGLVLASGARAKITFKEDCLVLDEREGNAFGHTG